MDFKQWQFPNLVLLVLLFYFQNDAHGQISNKEQCFVSGECTHSPLISSAIKPGPNECLKSCQELDSCGWFSFDPSINYCLLFANCTQLDVETCPQCISGQSSCEVALCNLQGVCQGNLLEHGTQASLRQCMDQCQSSTVDNCQWFSFNGQDRICLLFETCPVLDEEAQDFVSGQKMCQIVTNDTSCNKKLTKIGQRLSFWTNRRLTNDFRLDKDCLKQANGYFYR